MIGSDLDFLLSCENKLDSLLLTETLVEGDDVVVVVVDKELGELPE